MEKDLFEPIKKYFEGLGYVCDGEVEDIDLYMEKEEESVAVELKVSLDFKAVQQAALRQKLTDTVYIGIFKPKDLYSRAGRDKLYLLKRLGIGLIVVSKRTGAVEIVSDPVVSELACFKRSNKGKKMRLTTEFKKRRTKSNVGGVTGKKLITSYREDALLVLDALMECEGEASSREIKKLSGIERSTKIMHDNHYSWFENVERGRYKVTEEGLKALEEFEDTIYLLKKNKASEKNI